MDVAEPRVDPPTIESVTLCCDEISSVLRQFSEYIPISAAAMIDGAMGQLLGYRGEPTMEGKQ